MHKIVLGVGCRRVYSYVCLCQRVEKRVNAIIEEHGCDPIGLEVKRRIHYMTVTPSINLLIVSNRCQPRVPRNIYSNVQREKTREFLNQVSYVYSVIVSAFWQNMLLSLVYGRLEGV